MGLKQIYLDYIHECIDTTLGELRGKRMLELGNQFISGDFVSERTGKEYFKNRGAEHVSIDLNGKDGALMLDLTKPWQFRNWQGYFDIVTNSGTSEHLEPKSAQYECFLIIHNCLKVGGIAIHLVPDIDELKNKGCWKGQGNNYYSHNFFRMLAENNNYRLISLKIIDGLICSCYQKTEEAPFMKDRKEFLRHITRKRGGVIYPGINDKGILRLYTYINYLRKATAPLRHRLGLYRWWRCKKT